MTQKHQHLLATLFLLSATWLVYTRATTCQFVNYDDLKYVVHNPMVQQGLTQQSIAWAFRFDNGMTNYHPLTMLSHMLDVSLFGSSLDAAPAHHQVNVLLHLLNTFLLLLLLSRLTNTFWPAWIVAGFFALHPVRVESVVWISERKDVLSTALALSCLLFYQSYAKRPATWKYLSVIVLFALSLLAKSMTVTLPIIMLLLDLWPLKRFLQTPIKPRQSYVLEKLPLFGLSFAMGIATLIIQQNTHAIRDFNTLPWIERASNIPIAYLRYLGKTFWPTNLAIFYPPVRWALWQSLLATAILLIMSATAIWQFKKRPYLTVGWFWFIIMLLPVIGIVQVGDQFLADRYQYLPSVGIYIALVWWCFESWPKKYRQPQLAFAIVMVLWAALAQTTWRQIGHWRNSLTLWQHAAQVTRANDYAQYNLGSLYMSLKETELATHYFRRALSIKEVPWYHLRLAIALMKLHRFKDAETHVRKQTDAEPQNPLGWRTLGEILFLQKHYNAAQKAFEKSLNLEPHHLKTRTRLTACYLLTNQTKKVIANLYAIKQTNPAAALASAKQWALDADLAHRTQIAFALYQFILADDPHHVATKQSINRLQLKLENRSKK